MIPIVGGHLIGLGVSVVMLVVDDEAAFLGVFKPPDFSQEF